MFLQKLGGIGILRARKLCGRSPSILRLRSGSNLELAGRFDSAAKRRRPRSGRRSSSFENSWGRSSALRSFDFAQDRILSDCSRFSEGSRRIRLVPNNGTRSGLEDSNIGSSRGRSSAWLERLPVTQEVASSSLVGPAKRNRPT